MAGKLRVGVIGTSWFAETFHLAGLDSHPRAQITAICGRDRAKTEAVASNHGEPVVFTDYGEMIDSGLMDAVVIVTPDDLHREMTLRALQAGLHVMCEKPLARTADDARDMFDAAEAAGRVHMTMFTWRWIGIFAYAHRLIKDGYLGRCRDAQFSMMAGYADELIYGWRFDPGRGTGILGDLGSHMFDLARWYVGDIAQVSGRLTTNVARLGPDGTAMASLNDSATVLLEFANTAQATITVSGASVVGQSPEVEVRLYGDEGSLKLDFDLINAHVSGRRRDDQSWNELSIPDDLRGLDGGNPSIMNLPSLAPFTNLPVADRLFVDAVLDGRPSEATFEDGWRVQQVVDAVIESDRRHGWVAVPDQEKG
jgi:predicted dehydrogenase